MSRNHQFRVPFVVQLSSAVAVSALVVSVGACGVEVEPGPGTDTEADAFIETTSQGLHVTTVLTATADTQLSQNYPNSNYGSASTLTVDGDAPRGSGRDTVGVLLFDLSSLPGGAVISAAKLRLGLSAASSQAYEVYALSRTWTWNQATWNVAATAVPWATAGALGAGDRDFTALASFTPSVTGVRDFAFNGPGVAKLQSWLTTPSSNRGLIISDPANTDGMTFESISAADMARRPALVVTYSVPDTTPPETTISSGPAAGSTQTSTSASFAFTSSESGSTFECALDGAAFTACTSPTGYTGLSSGSHGFRVRATDAAGNTDATAATRTWTVQTSEVLRFYDTFDREADTFIPPWGRIIQQEAGRVTTTTERVRKGTHSVKLTALDTDNPSGWHSRADLVPAYDGPGAFTEGEEAWVGWSVLFPEDFLSRIHTPGWLMIAQHGYSSFIIPRVAYYFHGGPRSHQFDLSIRPGTSPDPIYIWKLTNSIPFGQWMDFVAHYKFSTDPNVGFIELWYNGVRQTFSNGSQRYYTNTLEPGSPRPGRIIHNNYRALGSMASSLTIYQDEIKVGSSYGAVAP